MDSVIAADRRSASAHQSSPDDCLKHNDIKLRLPLTHVYVSCCEDTCNNFLVILQSCPHVFTHQVFKETAILDKIMSRIVGLPSTFSAMILRLCIPTMLMSSVCSNGPLTTMCIPIVSGICERIGTHDVSAFLLAVTFGITLGGNL